MISQKVLPRLIIILVIAALFYAGILFFGDVELIFQKTSQINYQYFPYIFLLLAVQIFLSGLKFHRLLQKLHMHLPFKESLKLFLAGFAMGITPGGAGTIIKSYFLKKSHGKSISSSAPIVIIEKVTDLLSILIIMTFLLIWANFVEAKIVLVAGYAFFVFIMIFLSNDKIFFSFKGFISKLKFIKNFSENLEESRSSLKILIRSPNFMEALGYSVVIKIAQLFLVFFIFLAVGINLDLSYSGQIYYTSLLFGVLTFIPAGLVVMESSMISLLLKEGISLSEATLSVLLIRLITTWMVFALGGIMLRFLLKKKSITDD